MGKYKILGLANAPRYKILGRDNEQEEGNIQDTPEEQAYEPSSATGAFFRSAGRAIPEALQNVGNKMSTTFAPLDEAYNRALKRPNVNNERKDIIPEFLQEKSGDKSHPIAQFLGSSIGFLPLGGATIGAARYAIPAWNAIAKQAIPSLIRRAGVGAVEGAGLGAIYSPKGHEAEGALTGGLIGGAGYGMAPPIAKFIKDFPGRFKSIRDIDRLKLSLDEAGIRKEEANTILEQAKKESIHDFNTSNPDSLTFRINEAKKANEQLTLQTKPPEEPNMPPAHQFEKMEPKVIELLKTKEQNRADIEKQLSTHLGEGQLHHERFGTIVGEERNKLINENKNDYNVLKNNLTNKNVVIENKGNVSKSLQDVSDAIKSHGIESKEVQKLVDDINNISKRTITPANDYLSLNKSINYEAHEAWKIAKEHPDALVRDASYKRYEELKKQADITYKILKENIGEEDSKLLEKANEQFKNIIIPMRKNSVFKEIEKTGKVKGSLLEKSVGSEEGIKILQEMIENNPELQRLSVGQKFANAPEKLQNPNELLEKKYFPNMPKLKDLLENHQKAIEEHNKAKESLELAKIHDMEQSIIAKEREAQRKKIQKEHDKKQNDAIKAQKEHKETEIKIEKMDKKLKELNEKQNNTDLLDREYKKIQEEINAAENDKDNLKKKLIRLSVLIGSLGGAVAGIKSIMK